MILWYPMYLACSIHFPGCFTVIGQLDDRHVKPAWLGTGFWCLIFDTKNGKTMEDAWNFVALILADTKEWLIDSFETRCLESEIFWCGLAARESPAAGKVHHDQLCPELYLNGLRLGQTNCTLNMFALWKWFWGFPTNQAGFHVHSSVFIRCLRFKLSTLVHGTPNPKGHLLLRVAPHWNPVIETYLITLFMSYNSTRSRFPWTAELPIINGL